MRAQNAQDLGRKPGLHRRIADRVQLMRIGRVVIDRRFEGGKLGVLQGCKTWILQDSEGQIELTHSVSAGLDYAAVGPEHAFYKDRGRIDFGHASDDEALQGFETLSKMEGVMPALESAHAVAYAMRRAPEMGGDEILCVNLSGRGDKDMQEAGRFCDDFPS